jgi:GGDEF domain-containing protein
LNPVLAALQILVVAAGSAAVLAFLVSNFRYRKLELLAEEEAATKPQISPSALVIQLLAELRKHEVLLCRIQTPNRKDALSIGKLLKEQTREGDHHAVVENGVVISRFVCPLDHAERLGQRLVLLLKTHGVTQGSCMIWEPELDTEALMTWILQGDGHEPTGPLRVKVDVSEAAELKNIDGRESLAIDPVTGVFREDRVSRAIRRRLAERSRLKKEGTMIRVLLDVNGKDADPQMKGVADILMANCRESDLIGRSGAAEFVLCLDGQKEEMENAARRMQQAITLSGVSTRFGLTCMPEHGDSPAQLFDRAGVAAESVTESDSETLAWFDPEMEAQPDTGEKGNFVKEEF